MKILFFDEWLPWPLDSGKKIRTYNLLAQLCKEHQIVLVAYADPAGEGEKIRRFEAMCHRVVPVPDRRTRKWTPAFYLAVLHNLFQDEPFSTRYHIRTEFARTLERVAEEERPDLVHCEWTNLAPLLQGVCHLPAVISSHNVESEIWARLALSGTNPLQRLIGRQQARRIEELERQWYPRASCCVAVSDRDSEIIGGYGARVVTVDNGVDLRYYDGAGGEAEPDTIVFTASFDTFSNQDGAEFFVREIWPLLRQQRPQLKALLVGKNPPERFKAFSGQGIVVTGTVEDVRPYIARSAVCVVPLRIGGGSRLKILEAMAMRKPVVSTSIGAEGLKVEQGRNIVIADTPRDFAESVLGLLDQEQQRVSLAGEAYRLVASCYDWRQLARKMSDAWALAREHTRAPDSPASPVLRAKA